MPHRDVLLSGKVGDRPRHLQDAVMCPGAESLLLHRPLEQALRIRRELAVEPNLLGVHLGVRKDGPRGALSRPLRPLSGMIEARVLPLPGGQNPGTYLLRPLSRGAAS